MSQVTDAPVRIGGAGEPAATATVLEAWADVEAVRVEWNALADAAAPDDLFRRFEWLDAAWQWAGADASPRVVCVRDGGELVGAVPLLVRRRRWHGLPVRSLEFITCPDTQSAGLLALPGHERRVCAAVAGTLAGRAADWDRMLLRHLDASGDGAAILLGELAARGLAVRAASDQGNPWIALDRSWEDYYATRSRRLKKGNNHVANRLQRDFDDIRAVHVTADSPPAAREALDKAIAISAASWKAETGNSLDNPGPAAFVQRLAAHAIEQGWFSVWLLELDGRAAAMELQLAYRGHVHALRSDYPESLGEHGVGRYLFWKIVESSCGRDLRRYWMGPGDNPYKSRWAEDEAPRERLTGFSPSLRGRGLRLLHGIAGAIKGRRSSGPGGEATR